MSEWKEMKLGQLITIKGGYSYKGEFIGRGDSILLGMGCVSNRDKFLFSGARAYFGSCPESHLADIGDLVLATRQQSDNLPILGLPAIIPPEFSNKKVIVGTNLYKVINTSDVSNKFIYWLLRSPEYYNHILSSAKGSTVRMITKDAVESFNFMCPSKEDRDNIENTLSSLDDKIDLLHRNNKTLEQLAETLFRQWLKTLGNREFTKLGDYVKIQNGYAFKSSDFKESGNNGVLKITNISSGKIDINNTQFVEDNIIKNLSEKYLAHSMSFLIAMTGAEIGKIGIVGKTKRKLFINQRVGKLMDVFDNSSFIGYLFLNSAEGQEHIINTCTGSAQENISSLGIESMLVPQSMPEEIVDFCQKIKLYFYIN